LDGSIPNEKDVFEFRGGPPNGLTPRACKLHDEPWDGIGSPKKKSAIPSPLEYDI